MSLSKVIIPNDWKICKVGDVLKLGSGRDYKHLGEGDIPVFGTGGKITSVNDYLFEGESVGIGRKGTIDKPVFLTGKFWTVDTLFYTHSFNGVLPYFIYLVFWSINWRKHSEATGVPSLSRSIIEPIKIPIPPLPEQQKIAEILSTVDDKIDIIDQQISANQELKKGLMQQLLSKGIGHTEFKDSPLGEIPKSWEVVKLGDVSKIERGKFQHRPRNAPEFYGGSYPYVQTGDISKSNGKIVNYSQTLNELGLSVSKLFPIGTIVITIAANIGDTAIAQFEVAFPDSLIGIVVDDKTNNVYLRYYLSSQKNNLNKLSTVSAQKNINLETLKPYKIPIPPIEEQQKIASILTSVDDKLEVLSHKKEHFQQLKKGLMQQLLTGKIRVKV